MSLLYHPGKANVVANDLSRLSMGNVAYVEEDKKKFISGVHQLSRLGIRLVDSAEGSVWVLNSLESSLVAEVKGKQDRDTSLVKLKDVVRDEKVEVLS